SAGVIRGLPIVQTTGMLEIQGRVVPLFGVEGVRGRPAREFTRYLGRREVACEPAGSGDVYRCRVGNQDLSRVVLFNGGRRRGGDGTGGVGCVGGEGAPKPGRHLERTGRGPRLGPARLNYIAEP